MVAGHYYYVAFIETYTIEIVPTEKFSFNTIKWLAWKKRFERFRVALDLCNKTGERQVAMLIYAMNENAEDIFCIIKVKRRDSKKYDIVFHKFENHFIVKKNNKF